MSVMWCVRLYLPLFYILNLIFYKVTLICWICYLFTNVCLFLHTYTLSPQNLISFTNIKCWLWLSLLFSNLQYETRRCLAIHMVCGIFSDGRLKKTASLQASPADRRRWSWGCTLAWRGLWKRCSGISAWLHKGPVLRRTGGQKTKWTVSVLSCKLQSITTVLVRYLLSIMLVSCLSV